MAAPGYSVSELVQALSKTKELYDAFLQKNKNNLPQVGNLVEDIENFSSNLLKYRDIFERHGMEHSGIHAVLRTLQECHEFLINCESIVDKSFSAFGAFRNARFAFVQDDLARLRSHIKRHEDNIILQSVNAVLL
jgi:hypothetical protein